MRQVYFHDWEDGGEESMLTDFGIEKSALDGFRVRLASYSYENYSGDAYVLLQKDGKWFEVHGGHCSCYGLSESGYSGQTQTQWEPEETEAESIRRRVEAGTWGEEAKLKERVLSILDGEE